MASPKTNLTPIMGVNVYKIPVPELVEQLKVATNDQTYKGDQKGECASTSLGSPSDTLPTSNVIPIHNR